MKSVNVKESGRTVKRQSIIAIDGMHTQLMMNGMLDKRRVTRVRCHFRPLNAYARIAANTRCWDEYCVSYLYLAPLTGPRYILRVLEHRGQI